MESNQTTNARNSVNDDALTIALAEYEHLRHLRIAHTGNASNQVGQLFLAASVAVAAIATLTGLAGNNIGDAVPVALLGIGGTVVGLGLLVYIRMQQTKRWRFVYDTSLAALRTYMMRRAPEVEPYILEHTLHIEPTRLRPHRRGVLLVIALANSLLVGIVGSYAAWICVLRQPVVAAIVGAIGFIVCLTGHITFDRLLVERTNRLIDRRKSRRGWDAIMNEAQPSEVLPSVGAQPTGQPAAS